MEVPVHGRSREASALYVPTNLKVNLTRGSQIIAG